MSDIARCVFAPATLLWVAALSSGCNQIVGLDET
jgi:hypothetical protein